MRWWSWNWRRGWLAVVVLVFAVARRVAALSTAGGGLLDAVVELDQLGNGCARLLSEGPEGALDEHCYIGVQWRPALAPELATRRRP